MECLDLMIEIEWFILVIGFNFDDLIGVLFDVLVIEVDK